MTSNPIVNVDGTIQSYLSPIRAIRLLYMKKESDSISLLAVVAEKDFAVERMIYDRQLEIMDACPGLKLDLRVISLRGRELTEVISPSGTLLPAKAAA